MDGEECFAHKRRRFHVTEKMEDEMARICVTRIGILVNSGRSARFRAVIVYYDLVDGEDCQGTGDARRCIYALLCLLTTAAGVSFHTLLGSGKRGSVLGDDAARYGNGDCPLAAASRPEPSRWLPGSCVVILARVPMFPFLAKSDTLRL